jgi:hypothetical protein
LAALALFLIFSPVAEASGGASASAIQIKKVVLLVGPNLSQNAADLDSLRTMVEHLGFGYSINTLSNMTLDPGRTGVVIALASTWDTLNVSQADSLSAFIVGGGGVVWAGGKLVDHLFSVFGVQDSMNTASLDAASAVQYGSVSTLLFNESLYPVRAVRAEVSGYFTDNTGSQLAPAETTYSPAPSAGRTYYFAYHAFAWWNGDPANPWLRAQRIELALEGALSGQSTIRLGTYPDGMKSAFLTRIEDVDPLHTGSEWLKRANDFLGYYASHGAYLSVALIPMYVDPSANLQIPLGAQSASMLRAWLTEVVVHGGSILQHGYTHQAGSFHTGSLGEFYDNQANIWLTLAQQRERILLGREEIQSAMGINVTGFVTPNYSSDNDTYAALESLGFQYVTEDHNTPYADRYGLDGLINIPETMGYIPINASSAVQAGTIATMDTLYSMGGVMQFYDHLYDGSEASIGEALLDHSMTLRSVWYTDPNQLAIFWQNRFRAYDAMSTQSSPSSIDVTLGPASTPGLTLVLANLGPIAWVTVDGRPWSSFNGSEVVLPALSGGTNQVVIGLSGASGNGNSGFGLGMSIVSVATSIAFVTRIYQKRRIPRK